MRLMAPDPGRKFLMDPYLEWCKGEGIPIVEDFGIDILAVETRRWDRYDAKGAFIHVKGRGDFASVYALDIPPGSRTSPQRHLFEELVYVLEGQGSTIVEAPDGSRHTFEWAAKSLFALPLNCRYQHFNGMGRQRALLACSHDLPITMNLIHDEAFIFDNPYVFKERFGDVKYYSGEGDFIPVRVGRHMWETNFIADLTNFELKTWNERGKGSAHMSFVLADGTMHAHVSEIPTARYKKAHRHLPGFHIFAITGTGYTLLWYENEQEFRKVPWRHGTMYAPPLAMFHQHFNDCPRPARYLAIGLGSRRYPFSVERAEGIDMGSDTSLKEGGIQIECEDQDPRIHAMWLKAIADNGVASDMGEIIDESLYTTESVERPVSAQKAGGPQRSAAAKTVVRQ